MLEGKLDAEKAEKWAWDRSDGGGAWAIYKPARDLKEIAGYTEINANFTAGADKSHEQPQLDLQV
jgi:hypothetical protein